MPTMAADHWVRLAVTRHSTVVQQQMSTSEEEIYKNLNGLPEFVPAAGGSVAVLELE